RLLGDTDRPLELDPRENPLEPVGRRRLGRADDPRSPGDPLRGPERPGRGSLLLASSGGPGGDPRRDDEVREEQGGATSHDNIPMRADRPWAGVSAEDRLGVLAVSGRGTLLNDISRPVSRPMPSREPRAI